MTPATAARLPLVLAALPEHQAHFRALSHNPFLPRPASSCILARSRRESRVGTLLVAADRRIRGSVDATQGAITHAGGAAAAATDAGISDVLDDLAEAALRAGGEVIVLEAARKPSRTAAAAVFRY